MNTVFLDTVGLLALWDEDDQWHEAAQAAYQQVIEENARLVTSSFVLLECGNAAARRPYRGAVDDLRQELEAAGQLIVPSEKDVKAAWVTYRRGKSHDPGIVDCVSFEVMRRLGITRAFTNDSHFQVAGFEVLF